MRVEVDTRSFRRYRDQVDRDVRAAVADATTATKHAARSVPSPLGYDLTAVRAGIHEASVRQSARGWYGQVVGTHPLTWVFERGSYARLGRRTSTRGRSRAAGGNRGVKPTRMLRTAKNYGRGVLFRELTRRLR